MAGGARSNIQNTALICAQLRFGVRTTWLGTPPQRKMTRRNSGAKDGGARKNQSSVAMRRDSTQVRRDFFPSRQTAGDLRQKNFSSLCDTAQLCNPHSDNVSIEFDRFYHCHYFDIKVINLLTVHLFLSVKKHIPFIVAKQGQTRLFLARSYDHRVRTSISDRTALKTLGSRVQIKYT